MEFGNWEEAYYGEGFVVLDGKQLDGVDGGGDAAIEKGFMEATHEELASALKSANFAVEVTAWDLAVGHSVGMQLVAPKP